MVYSIVLFSLLGGGWLKISLWLIAFVVLLWIALKFFVNVGADEIATIERKYLGKEMADGRTIALSGEVGIQAKILGPGLHFLVPFIVTAKKHKYKVIAENEIGVVEAVAGKSIPQGSFMAADVECNLFQDGEAFLKNGGQKGMQIAILPPGQHRINPSLFNVSIEKVISIGEGEIGIVEAIAGLPLEPGKIFASPVECNSFQDAKAFLASGQRGPQIQILTPGSYRINTYLFSVETKNATIVNGGKLRTVIAMDGAQMPVGRILADVVEGHDNFQKAIEFIKNGGQKGRQLKVLMPGTYYINTKLFEISEEKDWTTIEADKIGIITTQEGKPINDTKRIAAVEVSMDKHDNFQSPAKFLDSGGEKGLQIPVLTPGSYAINPWFANIKIVAMTSVQMGFCGVVTSFVGEEGQDLTENDVNAKIVKNGEKGIWVDPLQPGKHPINTDICKVDIVPTTQMLLSWADSRTSAHKMDENLKTITLRTADAFSVNMDVNVIVHIQTANAPKVIANLGSIANLISQVLEPAISSHFRNAAQSIKALELYTKRKELQEAAKKHIEDVLRIHHIDSKDTLIADVVLPEELTQPVREKQIAEQEEMMYETKMKAQNKRKDLENATANANMQKDVVTSERGIEIADNIAKAAVKKSEGEKTSAINAATGKAEAVKLEAGANAEKTKLNASADAEATKVNAAANKEKGLAEAAVILEKGKSTAEAYNLEVKAMGESNFGRINALKEIKELKLKLVPEVLIIGGSENGGGIDNFLKLSLLEKVTGKDFLSLVKDNAAPAASSATEEKKGPIK